MISRRKLLSGILAGSVIAGAGGYYLLKPKEVKIGFELSNEELLAAKRLIQKYPVIDSHAHPGRTFVRDAENLNWKLSIYKMLGTFEEDTIQDMHTAGITAAAFNGVADFQLLSLTDKGLAANREFEKGEAWKSYQTQIKNLRILESSGHVSISKTPADIFSAYQLKKPGAILAMEGADFLENKIERLQSIYDDGVRMLTVLHYHNNSLGDIITGDTPKQGLTAFGSDVIKEMNRLGIIIDAAHASEKTAFSILNTSMKPIVVSHSHFNSAALTHPRFISKDLAKAVASSGGFIGAWPAGIGIDTLAGFIDRIEGLIELVGENHVALGSDMDANYKPVLDNYRKMPQVVGALSKRGHSEEVIAKFLGGNFLRVMSDVQAV